MSHTTFTANNGEPCRLCGERFTMSAEQIDALRATMHAEYDGASAQDIADDCDICPKHSERVVLWALPQGETDRLFERPLTSMPLTHEEAERVEAVATKDGWHGFRRAVDTNALPDFGRGVR